MPNRLARRRAAANNRKILKAARKLAGQAATPHVDRRLSLRVPVKVTAAAAAGERDRFEIEQPIGIGGMGTVFRARDPLSGEAVAVKVISSEQGHVAGRRPAEGAGDVDHAVDAPEAKAKSAEPATTALNEATPAMT